MGVSTSSSLPNRAMRLRLEDRSHVAEARRRTADLARQLDWPESRQGDLSIIVTELAQNVVRHARSGELLVGHLQLGARSIIDVVAMDRGPGIPDVAAAMTDGYSTGGTPGTGLGAVQRLADETDVHSQPGAGGGTAVLARVYRDRRVRDRPWLEVGAFALPRPGESHCGDAWACRCDPEEDEVDLLVADGLGHGPDAAAASRAAVESFTGGPRSLPQRLAEMHLALRSTRGAAVAMSRIHRTGETLEHLAAGNVAGLVTTAGRPVNLLTRHGTVGLATPRAEPMRYNLPARGCLVLHSDGLASRWRPEAYAGLWRRHCGLLAGLLIRDHARGTDDVTVLVSRRRSGYRGSGPAEGEVAS